MSIQVGEVVSVKGVKVTLRIFEESSKDTLFYEGEKYKGVSIKEYLVIQRGFRDIVCLVEGEYLDEKFVESEKNKISYIRKVEVKPIGYFNDGKFFEGIKYLPMIKDPALLASEDIIGKIYNKGGNKGFAIGNMLKEEIPVSLPWKSLFNTHIGIFGNTGSGKSNTLTKLYTTLFKQKIDGIRGKSKFVWIDFNGEYTQDQLLGEDDKDVINMSTRDNTGQKFFLSPTEFWDKEALSILFKATANTQSPFLNRLVTGRERYVASFDSLATYIKRTFRRAFTTTSPKRESIELLKGIVGILGADNLSNKLGGLYWDGRENKFRYRAEAGVYFFDGEDRQYNQVFRADVEAIAITSLDAFDELTVRVNLQLVNDLLYGYVQFEHIQPLLKRIEASSNALRRVVDVAQPNDAYNQKTLTVISLRRCNQEIKKIVPLLLAKHFYQMHKNTVGNPPEKTMHVVIDEAHNILSQQSTREQESWKDYRLELFEEIIKEGRKFGIFLTLSSQRPADISPTIMSQLHNFFIHRLVNDKDLFLLDNTISTLDVLSKSMIPNLSRGCCIVTGTTFDLPLVMQVDLLERSFQPDSDDVKLGELWAEPEEPKEDGVFQ